MRSRESVTVESFRSDVDADLPSVAAATSARRSERRDEPLTHTKALFPVGLILFSPIPENSAAPNISGPRRETSVLENFWLVVEDYSAFATFTRCLRQASNPTAPTASNASEPGSGI
jgi:hypothetical protein